MKSNATKSPKLGGRLQRAGRRWNPMKRSVLEVGLLAALSASSALAQLRTSNSRPGRGRKPLLRQHLDQQFDDSEHSGSLVYNTSTLPATGLWMDVGDYWFWNRRAGLMAVMGHHQQQFRRNHSSIVTGTGERWRREFIRCRISPSTIRAQWTGSAKSRRLAVGVGRTPGIQSHQQCRATISASAACRRKAFRSVNM